MTPRVPILESMRSSYARASAYRDRGSVRASIHGPGHRETHELTFETVFERPRTLRFAMTDARGLITSYAMADGATAVLRDGSFEQELPISSAVASLAGISFIASQNVPRLLLPSQIHGRSLCDVDPAKVSLRDAQVGDDACSILDAREKGRVVRLILRKRDFALKQVREDIFATAETIRGIDLDATASGKFDDDALESALSPGLALRVQVDYHPELDPGDGALEGAVRR